MRKIIGMAQISTSQAARILGVGAAQVRYLIRTQQLPATLWQEGVRSGIVYAVEERAVRKLLASGFSPDPRRTGRPIGRKSLCTIGKKSSRKLKRSG